MSMTNLHHQINVLWIMFIFLLILIVGGLSWSQGKIDVIQPILTRVGQLEKRMDNLKVVVDLRDYHKREELMPSTFRGRK